MKIEIVQKLCLMEGRQWCGGGRDRELPVASTPNYPLCGEAELWGDSGDCDTTHLPHTYTRGLSVSPFSPSRVPWLIFYEL